MAREVLLLDTDGRYILCKDCEALWRQDLAAERDRVARLDEPEGFPERMRTGKTRRDLRCDGPCNRPMPAGTPCAAVTVMADGAPGAAWPWEQDYLVLEPVWWWLSFADPERERGEQFLGALVVGPVPDFHDAVIRANDLNPGGEIIGSILSDDELEATPQSYRGRLLSKTEVEELSALWGGHGEVERMPVPRCPECRGVRDHKMDCSRRGRA